MARTKTAMTKINVFPGIDIEIRADLYKKYEHTLFTKQALRLAVSAQRVNEPEYGKESKTLVAARANPQLRFSNDKEYKAIRDGNWTIGANAEEIAKLEEHGTSTLVHPGQNLDHCINADNMRLDKNGKSFSAVENSGLLSGSSHMPEITDREDAGSLDVFQEHATILNAKKVRDGGVTYTRAKDGKKYQQERKTPLPNAKARKSVQRVNGLQSPEFTTDEIRIRIGDTKIPVRRMEWEIAMEYAAGTRDFLIPKLHNAAELKYIHDLMGKIKARGKEYGIDTSRQVKVDFLVEVADMPYQLEEAIFFLGGGNVQHMLDANKRGKEYILPEGELAHKLVFGGWDYRANLILKQGKLGVPDISGAEDYMAYVADKRGALAGGSMYVGLTKSDLKKPKMPNIKPTERGYKEAKALYNSQMATYEAKLAINKECLEGLKVQKTRDRMFHDTWLAQASPDLINASNEIMSQPINKTPVHKLRLKKTNTGQQGLENYVTGTLKTFNEKTYTQAEFDDLVELFYRYTLLYVAGDAHGCIPNIYMSDSLAGRPKRDMHDPATATERTRAILHTLVAEEVKLDGRNAPTCDQVMLNYSLIKAIKYNNQGKSAEEIANQKELQNKVYDMCFKLCTTKNPAEYGLYEIFELQRDEKLKREPAPTEPEVTRGR